MKNTYKTIHEYGENEVIINKSRFIGYAKPVKSEEEAIAFIEEIKTKHKDATHNVYAYAIGENSNIQRYSDDGEPSGTAGIPALEVIKKEELRNVAVVVTRYFGGVKLGVGGLVRAYTKGAKAGIEAGGIVEKILFKRVKIRIEYTLYGRVENELLRQNYIIEDVIYDDAVNVVVLCKKSKVEDLIKLMTQVTSANMDYEEGDEEFFSVKEGELII